MNTSQPTEVSILPTYKSYLEYLESNDLHPESAKEIIKEILDMKKEGRPKNDIYRKNQEWWREIKSAKLA